MAMPSPRSEVNAMSRNWLASRRLSDEWVGRCRDEAGRRRNLLVVLTRESKVALVVPPGEVAVLNLITVGQLRAVLREAVFALDDPNVERPYAFPVPTDGFHLDGLDERGRRPRWLSRLFCHPKHPVDVGRDAAEHQNAPTSTGFQSPSADAQVMRGRRSA
jgi:hypothetical protein